MTDSSSAPVADLDTELDVNDTAAAPPSDADEGVKDYQTVIEEALGGVEEAPASRSGEEVSSKPKEESGQVSPKEGEDGEAEKAKPEDPSEEEIAKYSQNAQRRIREVIAHRKEVEGQLETVTQEVETLRPQAEQTQKLNQFLQENRIEPQQFQNTMAIAALIQTGRYDDALKIVQPIYDQLLQVSGRGALPDDLAEEVRLGYITEKRARELHQTRTAGKNAETRQQAEQQSAQQREAQEAHAKLTGMMARTGDAWAQEKATSDPDWSLKQKLVTDEIELKLRRMAQSEPDKLPRDEKAVRKFLDETLADVEKTTSAFRPQPKPINPMETRPASQGSRPKPASYMDAIDQALYGG